LAIASAGVFSVLFVLGAFASMGVASPRGVGWVVNSCGFFTAGVVCFNDKSFLTLVSAVLRMPLATPPLTTFLSPFWAFCFS